MVLALAFILAILLFFTAFFWGKVNAFNHLPKYVEERINKTDNTLNMENLKKDVSFEKDNFTMPTFLLGYLFLVLALLFIGFFSDWRDNLLKDYEDGNYVKAVSTTSYTVPSDTLKYHRVNDTYFLKKARFEKKVAKGEVEKE